MRKLIKYIFNKFGYSLINNSKLIHNNQNKSSYQNSVPIVEMDALERNLIENCLNFSMISKLGMWNLLNSFHYVINNKIPGDFVECGVWKGGCIALLKYLNDFNNIKRNIYAYDTFQGLPEPGIFDDKIDGRSSKNIWLNKNITEGGWCKSELDEVKKNIRIVCNDLNKINFVKGKVEETLLIKKNLPQEISILRLDTDFYESTKIELEVLFPRLSKGGILIIDDYGSFVGSKKAVDEYFQNKPFLIFVDSGSRMLIKN